MKFPPPLSLLQAQHGHESTLGVPVHSGGTVWYGQLTDGHAAVLFWRTPLPAGAECSNASLQAMLGC